MDLLGLIIYGLTFFIILCFYRRGKLEKTVAGLLVTFTFVPFLVLIISPSFYFFYSGFFHSSAVLLFLYYLLRKIRNNKNPVIPKYIFHLLLAFFITVAYMYLVSKMHGNSPTGYLGFITLVSAPVFLFIVLFESFKERSGYKWSISQVNIVRVLYLLVFIQALLGVMQFSISEISNLFQVAEVTKFGTKRTLINETLQDKNLVLGTFVKVANFGNTIALLVVYLFGKKMLQENSEFNKYELFTLILGVIAIILGGVRNSFVTLFVGITTVVFFKDFKKGAIFVLSSIFLFLFYQQAIEPFVMGASSRAIGFENPLGRLSGLFVLFYDGSISSDNLLTLQRSVNLLDNISGNLFFGSGQYHSVGHYAGVDSITDAYLLFLIAEFGIIGFLLLISPFLLLIKYLCNHFYGSAQKKLILTIFGMLVLQMIVDQGLLSPYGAYFFVILILIEALKNMRPKILFEIKYLS